MTHKFGLPDKTIHSILAIFKKYPDINKVILYGSRATGKYKNASDIDITLIAPDLNFTQLLEIENKIDDLLLPYKVDLSLHHAIDNKDLLKHIQDYGVEFSL